MNVAEERELYNAAESLKRYFPEVLLEAAGDVAGGAGGAGGAVGTPAAPAAPVEPPQAAEQGEVPPPEAQKEVPGDTPKEEQPVDENLKGKVYEFIAEFGEVNEKLLSKYSDFEEYDPKQIKAALKVLKENGKINSKKIWYAVVQNDLDVETDKDEDDELGISDQSVEDTESTKQEEPTASNTPPATNVGGEAQPPIQPPPVGGADAGGAPQEAPAAMKAAKKSRSDKRKTVSDTINLIRYALDKFE